MAYRNQNRPPCCPSIKKEAVDEAQLDKQRRTRASRMQGQTGNGPKRQPFSSVNNRQDVSAATAMNSNGGSETININFTKEEVEALLNEKLKSSKFDLKNRWEQLANYSKRLKLCIKWFQRVEDGLLLEQEKLRCALEFSENKCSDTEVEMRIKVDELVAVNLELKGNIGILEQRIAKEESDKLDAINCHRREMEARDAAEKLQASLASELEKTREEKLSAEKRVSSSEDLYNRAQEYNKSLQQYNTKLQTDLATTMQSLERVEKEKMTIVENLGNLRGHNKTLQDQLTSIKASQDETIKQKESLLNELLSIRAELQQVREDRNRQMEQIQDLTGEMVKYEELTGKSVADLDSLTIKSNAMEETCSSQRKRIHILEHQLAAANEKIKDGRFIRFSDKERI